MFFVTFFLYKKQVHASSRQFTPVPPGCFAILLSICALGQVIQHNMVMVMVMVMVMEVEVEVEMEMEVEVEVEMEMEMKMKVR